MSEDWQPISTAPEGKAVLTKIDDTRGVRNIQTLERHGQLWFTDDGGMYVFYQPTHWKMMSYEDYIAGLEERLQKMANMVGEYLKFKEETPHEPPKDRPAPVERSLENG